jgi:uncharacterized protein
LRRRDDMSMDRPVQPSYFEALSDDEVDTLVDLLDVSSPFDFDGLLGMLHAVVVAPSVLQPSIWFPVLAPEGLDELDEQGAKNFVALVLRQYNDVADALAHDTLVMPDPDDVEGCQSFAAGYVAGAELDPEWIGDAARWTFAVLPAYLAGRLDLVPHDKLQDIEQHLAPDPKKILRRQLGGMVLAARDSFERYRRDSISLPLHPKSKRVGRNDSCPCGSGKKYKRCCLDRDSELGPA